MSKNIKKMAPAKTKKEIVYSDSESEFESDFEEDDFEDDEKDPLLEDDEKEERIIDDDDEEESEEDSVYEEDEEENEEEEQQEFEEEVPIEECIGEDIGIEEAEESIINIEEEPATKYTKKRTLKVKYYQVPGTYKQYNFVNDLTREKVVSSLFDILENQKNAETFEKYIYQSVGSDIEKFENKFKYIETFRNLIDYLINIKADKNLKLSDILNMLKNDKINFSADFYEPYREEIKKELKKSQLSVEVVEGLFECPKCKGKETESYSVQLRRADEPPTVFIECINKRCKHKWRMG
jgi:DNA-directed RNA polymerase subunit M/transcription elongation factor TFIIS